MTVDELLARARGNLRRLEPAEALTAMERGAVLVDIRSESQRAGDGVVPGAVFIPRNVLKWRCDPASAWYDERLRAARGIVLMCDGGYQSSLAAVTLRECGVDATYLVGGFQAWRDAGLAVEPASAA
jgi:rhodanese-related sulfurtransferase